MHDVDLIFCADKAHREPLLRLAAIFALPGLTDEVARNVVFEPVRDLADALDGADIGFFAQLALRRRPGLFAGIDAALRHLPDMGEVDMFRAADSPADEGKPIAIEQHHADAGPIRKIFEFHKAGARLGSGGSGKNSIRYFATSPFTVVSSASP